MNSENNINNIESEDIDVKKIKLYFDRNKQYFIEFSIDKKTNCLNIYSQNKPKFIENLKLIKDLPEKFNLDEEIENDNYYFCISLIETKLNQNNVSKTYPLLDIKLDLDEKIYDLNINNENAYLCFFEKNNSKIKLRRKARNLFFLDKDIYANVEQVKIQEKKNIDKNIKEILYNKNIFFFNNITKNFVKKEITIDNEKMNFIKDKFEIYINQIKSIIFFLYDSEEFKKADIKGDKMYGYIQIITNKKIYFLFGHKKADLYYKLVNVLTTSLNNFHLTKLLLEIDNDIYYSKCGLFTTFHLIVGKCFSLKGILSNHEKRKIFLSIFPQKKVGEILDKIIEYKSLNKKGKYLESLTNFKQIFVYLNPYREMIKNNNLFQEKYKTKDDIGAQINELIKVLKKVDLDKFQKISDSTNEAVSNLLGNMKKENNINNDFQKSLNGVLKDFLSEDLFDELLKNIYNSFILPYYNNKIKKNIKKEDTGSDVNLINQKFQFLLAFYYFKFVEMKLYLLGKEEDIK